MSGPAPDREKIRRDLREQAWRDRAQVAEAENERLREALEFYAEQYGLGARLASDGGRIARGALAARTEAQA